MKTYRTFLRTAKNFEEFSKAEKIEQETDLSLDEAREACKDFNSNRTETEIDNGTKLEFEEE